MQHRTRHRQFSAGEDCHCRQRSELGPDSGGGRLRGRRVSIRAKLDVHLQRELVCKGGLAAEFDEAALKEKLDVSEVRIRVTLNGKGKGQARFFTCDLTEGYIQINGSYRT